MSLKFRDCSTALLITIATAVAGCGQPVQEGTDIIIIPQDTVTHDGTIADFAADAQPATDTAEPQDLPEIHVTDLTGVDVGKFECDEDLDCPQSGLPCEWVACHPVDNICYQANSHKSGDMCDEGYKCRKDGHCQGGVCVYSHVECAECGDLACFDAGENCRDCPQDCGVCPATDTDCADLVDNDMDGDTDCDDVDDCGNDPRCQEKTCKDFPEASLTCGQELELWLASNPFLNEEELCGIKVGYFVGLYEFIPELGVEASVRLTLEDSGKNMRYFVLEGACNENNCILWSDARVKKTFTANRGWKYYIVVEEIESAFGDKTIMVECK